IVEGRAGKLKNSLLHENLESISHHILKHDKYSNWEARMLRQDGQQNRELAPSLFGTQAQRRRWLKRWFYWIPGSPVLFFLYRYIFRLGVLDGVPGLIYCTLQAVHMFNI